MKIWFQKHITIGRIPLLDDGYEVHARKIVRADTVVNYQGVPKEAFEVAVPSEMVNYVYSEMMMANYFLSRALEAEKAGFDAYIIGTATDPGLREIKTVVDIPVIAYSEASLHVANMLGSCISYVGFIPGIQARHLDNARQYGLGERMGPLGQVPITAMGVQEAIEGKPGAFIDAFHKTAREVIQGGADVIVPNEGLTNEVLFREGIYEVDGVPIIDSNGLVLKMAEFMVDMKRVAGMHVSRKGHFYAKPPRDMIDLLNGLFGSK